MAQTIIIICLCWCLHKVSIVGIIMASVYDSLVHANGFPWVGTLDLKFVTKFVG